MREFDRKHYSKEEKLFVVEYREDYVECIRRFTTFEEFTTFLNGDLSDANLYDFDFIGVEIKKYNYEEAGISSDILKSQGLLDEKFYNRAIVQNRDLINQITEKNDHVAIKRSLPEVAYDMSLDTNELCVSYISDLHLDYKINQKYPFAISKSEIRDYIKTIVTKIASSLDSLEADILLICGDISFSFEISKMFYKELKKRINRTMVFVVLGNHEFWDKELLQQASLSKVDSIEFIVKRYREMLLTKGIHLVHNELVVIKDIKHTYGDKCYFSSKLIKVSENKINNLSLSKIKDITNRSTFRLLGGMGFSGYSRIYNASHNIYRELIKTVREDINYTQRFEKIYQKCKEILSDEKLIIMTHMPKDNWSKSTYCKEWIYVHGHNHQNHFEKNAERVIYADNQIGYYNEDIALKSFSYSENYNVFEGYEDGIHQVSPQDYMAYYRGRGEGMRYSHKNTILYMLKRDGVYCFVHKHINSGKYSILNGGNVKLLDQNKGLQYYYDNLLYYAKAVEDFISVFNERLKEVSKFIRSIGGSGKIHGLIVDIDFYNHVYINPFNGEMLPYYAISMVHKYYYDNLASLLFYRRDNLYSNYQNLIENKTKTFPLWVVNDINNKIQTQDTKKSTKSTEQYKFSKVAKDLQYITKVRVVRKWNDNLITNPRKTKSDNKKLIKGLLE